jgi:hypothetical protein
MCGAEQATHRVWANNGRIGMPTTRLEAYSCSRLATGRARENMSTDQLLCAEGTRGWYKDREARASQEGKLLAALLEWGREIAAMSAWRISVDATWIAGHSGQFAS